MISKETKKLIGNLVLLVLIATTSTLIWISILYLSDIPWK